MSAPTTPPAVRRVPPLLADLVCVLTFALGGRSAHEPGESGWVLLVIAWPFALAATLAHAVLGARGHPAGRAWPEGVLVLAGTYLLGMALRAATGRGTATGFLVVAAVFLAVTMLGWRTVAELVRRHRSTPT